MPAPTNVNVAVKLYTNRFIAKLQLRIALLKAFSTSFSDAFTSPGKTVDVPLISPDAAAEWDKTTNNYTASLADVKTRPVELKHRPIAKFAIDQDMLHNFLPSWWEGKADLNANEIALYIVQKVLGLVTPDNYGYGADANLVVTLAGFNRKKVGELRTKMVERGMIPERTALCLSPAFYSELLTDLGASIIGSGKVIEGGAIQNLLGFGMVLEVPGYTGPGFACHPDAIAVAGRRIAIADTTPYKQFGSIVEPNTGMHFNSVVLTNGPTGETSYAVESLFGFEVGNEGALVRLVTAMPTPPTP